MKLWRSQKLSIEWVVIVNLYVMRRQRDGNTMLAESTINNACS